MYIYQHHAITQQFAGSGTFSVYMIHLLIKLMQANGIVKTVQPLSQTKPGIICVLNRWCHFYEMWQTVDNLHIFALLNPLKQNYMGLLWIGWLEAILFNLM